MLREKLKGKKEEEYIEAILYLVSDNLANRAINSLENQANKIVDYLDNYSLVDKLDDKDDKTFDRGKMFLKDLPELVERIEKLKLSHLNLEDKTTVKKEARAGSILNYFE